VTEVKLSFNQQILLRLNEMKERRRRLVKYTYQKEGREFERTYQSIVGKKNRISRSFKTVQLESLLLQNTKNVALNVVQQLIQERERPGLLLQM